MSVSVGVADCCVREEGTSLYPQDSFGWSSNQIDMSKLALENNQI